MFQTAKSLRFFIYFDDFYSHLKNSENWPPDFIISRAWTGIGGSANNFPPFLGLYLTPPATQNIKKTFWWGPTIFQKWHPKFPVFGFSVLGNEYPVLVFEYRKWPGISRVNLVYNQSSCWEKVPPWSVHV